MRRVNIISGIKQKINDILGQGVGGSLTNWSIQSAMLSNLERLAKSLLMGSTRGKVMSGLNITFSPSSSTINISSGYGITSNGNIISLLKNISKDMGANEGESFLVLRYSLAPIQSGVDGYINTTIIGSTPEVISYDEYGAAYNQAIDTNTILKVLSTINEIQAGDVYIGKVTVSSGLVSSVSSSGDLYGRLIASRTVAQSLPSNSTTVIYFDTATEDSKSEYNSSTGIYTAGSKGYRQVNWQIITSSILWDAAGSFRTELIKNETYTVGYRYSGSFSEKNANTTSKTSQGSALVYLDAGDRLKVEVVISNQSGCQTLSSFYANYLTIQQVDNY